MKRNVLSVVQLLRELHNSSIAEYASHIAQKMTKHRKSQSASCSRHSLLLLAGLATFTEARYKQGEEICTDSNSAYLKDWPKPRAVCSFCANISYFLMSLSVTERRANFMASSKCPLLISGTWSSSMSYIVETKTQLNVYKHISF